LPVVVSILLGTVCISQLQSDDTKERQEIPDIVKAADRALKATMSEHTFGRASSEEFYQWSRRLMEAEEKHNSNKRAAMDHVDRMLQLHARAKARLDKGTGGGSQRDFYATEYYLLEAQENAIQHRKQ
jgi:enoyl reductase-like protein